MIDDSSLPEVGTSVISFSTAALVEKPEAVRGFLAALEMAVADLNDHPGDYIQLISDLGMVPAPLLATYQLPPYVTASVPSEAQWADALASAQDKGLIEGDLLYADSVDASYLP